MLKLKERFDRAGLYGKRISVHEGRPADFQVPQYFASLTIIGDRTLLPEKADARFMSKLFQSMRPYGGTAFFPLEGKDAVAFSDGIRETGLQKAKIGRTAGMLSLTREGALPGTDIWTHNYGDPGNTAKSDDDLVKLPLGILWFGGNSNLDVLPRHGHGPSEQVVGGRLFIQGMTSLSARDVYTGRVLWKAELLDLGGYDMYFNETYKDSPTNTRYNQVHLPGANVRGTNFIATEDRVYIIQGTNCEVLDAVTGKQLARFRMPPEDPEAKSKTYRKWAYISVAGDKLIGGYGFVPYSDLLMKKKAEYSIWEDFDTSASRGLVVMNRYTGEVLWKTDAETGFIHNGIAIGDTRIHCLDTVPPLIRDQLSRRGKTASAPSRLVTFDLESGKMLWEDRNSVFGSYLAWSKENDILVQSTRPSRDTVKGEDGKQMIAYRAANGSVIWDKNVDYKTFPVLHGSRIITEGVIFSLLNGEPETRTDPITGDIIPWTWKRMYGCNYPVASEHLLTFRSGAAGFMDFDNMGGTGNFGGFKSGCTISLIAADGVLNAPDYTRTCSCPYQNQTSLAMVYMPDADIETWTFDDFEWNGSRIERVGINFGAPGDHMDNSGTLWLDYPSVGGDSPDIPVVVSPEQPEWFRGHSSRISDGGNKWVTASGGEGIERIAVTLAKEPAGEKRYNVSLLFAEPEDITAGERVFDVALQGSRKVKKLDIVREAKGANRTIVKQFKNIKAGNELVIKLTPANGSKRKPLISGIEIVAAK